MFLLTQCYVRADISYGSASKSVVCVCQTNHMPVHNWPFCDIGAFTRLFQTTCCSVLCDKLLQHICTFYLTLPLYVVN